MQDFKTAHLLGVSPGAQLAGMLLGSAASVPLSVAAYRLYTTAWQVPGPVLPAPTAQIWLDMAKLVNGGRLPEKVGPFCAVAAAAAAALPLVQLVLGRAAAAARAAHVRQRQQRRSGCTEEEALPVAAAGGRDRSSTAETAALRKDIDGNAGPGAAAPGAAWRGASSPSWACHGCWRALSAAAERVLASARRRSAPEWAAALLPSGVGVAVGMYLTPNWTLPRLLGSIVESSWAVLSPGSHAAYMVVVASGLVLGEGCASILTALVQAVSAR